MPQFVLGICVLIGVLLMMRWLAKSEPKDVLKGAKGLALVLIVGIAVFLIVTGRLAWALAALAALVPWAMRMAALYFNVRSAARMAKNFKRAAGAGTAGWSNGNNGGGDTGERSEINTRYLRMILDHDTGEMDGAVLDGVYSGQRLSSMAEADIKALLKTCWVEDADSAQILENYLDRIYPDWRSADVNRHLLLE